MNRSDANNNPETLIREKISRIPTDFLRTFPGGIIHGGVFKTLNSTSNSRVQLVVTSPYIEQTNSLFQNILELEYSTVDESSLNRYRFVFEECMSSSVRNNNYNNQVNYYAVSRSNNNVVQ